MDVEFAPVYTFNGTPANVKDVTHAGALLHGQETGDFGDRGYRGVEQRLEAKVPTNSSPCSWARRPPNPTEPGGAAAE